MDRIRSPKVKAGMISEMVAGFATAKVADRLEATGGTHARVLKGEGALTNTRVLVSGSIGILVDRFAGRRRMAHRTRMRVSTSTCAGPN